MVKQSVQLLIIALLLFVSTGLFARENSTELYKKGARFAVNGQFDKAINIFKEVIEISPYYCLGHYGIGKAYLYKYGMLDDAIRHLRKSVKYDRKFVKGHFYLAMAYFMAKNYTQAVHSFKRVYLYDDSYIEALYNIGVIYDIMDKKHESNIYFNKYFDEKSKEEEDIIF